ncbi:hypothetical protein G7046_g4407 [Stylonectria norvegica]|nr:hypothetical protein G7046_g4407 [Stylonectria norvegica]
MEQLNIVITGGGTGIGSAIAQAFAASGAASISILGRRLEALRETELKISSDFPKTEVFCHTTDLVDRESVLKTFDAIKTNIGTVDVLIANAGFPPKLHSIAASDDDEWFKAFEVNVKGNYNLVKAFLPVASKTASILNITAGATHLPYLPGFSGYHASKLAAVKIFDYIRHENPDLFVLNFHQA